MLPKGRQKWGNTLEHLIAGTEVIETDSGAQVGRNFVAGFGEMFLDKLGTVHVEEWPSSLRPLRRMGPKADVLWDEHKLLVRRSHTLGDEVMNTTKQRVKYRIHLPEEAMEVLEWHVKTQLETAKMKESELLFPAVTGGYRSPSVLNKPFEEVGQAIGLRQRFTQRGLRRTFNDLARAAVEGVVTKSISGHLTERMRERYSTVAPIEQRASIARVISFAKAKG